MWDEVCRRYGNVSTWVVLAGVGMMAHVGFPPGTYWSHEMECYRLAWPDNLM